MLRSRKRAETRQSDKEAEAYDLSGRLVTLLDPNSAAAEAYRTMRTNLLYAAVDNPPKVILLTSPGPREGKSTTCANLGVALAQAGKKTLLVDCDLRRPVMHKIFGLRNIWGVVNLLVEEREPSEVWHEYLSGLKVLTVGPVPPNPTELLGSRRFAWFLDQVRPAFDYVLLDAPPVGLVTDPAILATQSDGVLLALDAQSTRRGSLKQGLRSLVAVDANIIGTVMNNAKDSEIPYSYYGYAY